MDFSGCAIPEKAAGGAMFDEMEQLNGSAELRRLLAHYAQLGAADREAWQDRLMEMDGVAPKDLVRLHGELIAFGWVEQNTGMTPGRKPGVVAGCYRITAAGQKALKRALSGRPVYEEEAEAA
jgi:hypothetical protein